MCSNNKSMMTRGRNTQEKSNMSVSSVDSSLGDISEDGKMIVMAIRNDIEILRREFAEQLREKNSKIESLSREVTSLREKVNKLEEKIDEAEAYERRDVLVFSGEGIPKVQAGENCTTIVCDLMLKKLNLVVNQSDISVSHRLGRKPHAQRTDNRSIIIKLCRRDMKRDILSACRSMKPNFYVNESLTPTRNTILYVLRQAKKKKIRLAGCASVGGRVFAWVSPPEGQEGRDARIPVNTHQDLDSFCSKILREPLSNYLSSWTH